MGESGEPEGVTMTAETRGGMEDVVAGQSAITWIDGRAGQLRYRGYPIGELARQCTFEQVAYLIWHGDLPSASQAKEMADRLSELRFRYSRLADVVTDLPAGGHPLDVLRYVVSRDALDNPLAWDNSERADFEKALELTAWFPIVVAAYHRRLANESPVGPRPGLDTAANFLFMLHGHAPSDVAARTLNRSLVLHADHELNASTFAARVTIATQSNLHAAVASALGTLTGPRHGGASERVIEMLEEIGDPANTDEYVRRELSEHRRVMGFGHRVYRTTDPRSRHLREMAEQMLEGTSHEQWIEILNGLETTMQRERNLYPNVDLYAAVVNHELGIDPRFYTSVFAISRVVGWTAHAIEQLDGRMIRPVAEYVGPGLRTTAVGAPA